MTRRSRSLGAAACAVAALYPLAGLFLLPPGQDEIENVHAAWLISRGFSPFRDFFEHHSPILWWVLRAFFFFTPDSPWVVLWGRGLGAAILVISAWLIYRLGERLHSAGCGSLAASAWLLFSVATGSVSIRPEMLGLPILLAGLSLELERPGGSPLPTLLASLAFSISPRALPYLAVFGVLALPEARRRYDRAIRLAAAALTGPAILAWACGPGEAYRWVYLFSAHMLPSFPSWTYYPGQSEAKLLLLCSVGLALLGVLRPRDARHRVVSWLVLASAASPFLEARPFQQAYNYALPPALLLFSCQIAGWGARPKGWRPWAATTAFVLLCCVPWIRGGFLEPRVPRPTLWGDLASRSALARLVGDGTVLMSPEQHPVSVRDASYYWFSLQLLAAGTLVKAGIPGPGVEPLDDLKRSRPVLLSTEYLAFLWRMDADPAGFLRYVRENYRTGPDGLLVRR